MAKVVDTISADFRKVNLCVKIKVIGLKRMKVRFWIGGILIRFAGFVMNAKIETDFDIGGIK